MYCHKCTNSPVVKVFGNLAYCHDCYREYQMSGLLTKLRVMPCFHSARLWQGGCNIPDTLLGKSLFITGPAGTGKTHLAVALLVDTIKQTPFSDKLSVAFTTLIDLLDEIKATFNQPAQVQLDLIRHYEEVDFLVIDDIGVENCTEWAMVQVYRIVNSRWGCDKETVFTSNFNYRQLAEKLDTRIVSRIMGMCEVLELTGEDLRKRR